MKEICFRRDEILFIAQLTGLSEFSPLSLSILPRREYFMSSSNMGAEAAQTPAATAEERAPVKVQQQLLQTGNLGVVSRIGLLLYLLLRPLRTRRARLKGRGGQADRRRRGQRRPSKAGRGGESGCPNFASFFTGPRPRRERAHNTPAPSNCYIEPGGLVHTST